MSEKSESLDDLDCDALALAKASQVAVRRVIRKEYDSLAVEQRGRFKRIMEMWCEGHKLPGSMFNYNEGRTPAEKLMLQAFKAFKIRLYGFCRIVGGVNTFIIVDIDPAKKQDKADPGILKRAKGRVDEIGKGKGK